MIYVANIILQLLCPYIDEDARKLGRMVVVKDAGSIAKRYFSRYFLIDILAILPLPQVLVPIIFSETRGPKFLDKRKLLNAVVLFQYVPRVLRIYLSSSKLIRTNKKVARIVWIKAAFNFFLYIIASHVLGAFWYLFSIERETACWHIACENHTGCTGISYNCDHNLGNYTFLNDYCPIQTQNTTLFDFGIFLEALQSGTVASTDLPKKILYCFWWGLRNLSSVGQNLQTSTNFWENFFAVFISIFGLLLFLYFIGNVQTYMQMTTERSEEIIQKMKIKERELEMWISKHKLDDKIKREIISCIQRVLEENKDVDTQNPLPHLPPELKKKIKRQICLPLLKNVPKLKEKAEQQLLLICEYLKLVHYGERSYIVRKGDPLDAMLFITQGIVWTSINNNGRESTQCIERGHSCGEELLDWGFNGSPPSDLPISTKTIKAHTKVEAFALMANDLTTAVSRHTKAASDAASAVKAAAQAARLRLNEKKNENSSKMA